MTSFITVRAWHERRPRHACIYRVYACHLVTVYCASWFLPLCRILGMPQVANHSSTHRQGPAQVGPSFCATRIRRELDRRKARPPRHARHRSPRAFDPRRLPTPNPAPTLERRPPTPPTEHPYKARFFLGPFFQRNRKPVMMRTQATLKKFFQRLGKSVMMRTRTTQKFPNGPFFQRARKPVMMRARATRKPIVKFFQRTPKPVMMRRRATHRSFSNGFGNPP